jgi:hypothetical protein
MLHKTAHILAAEPYAIDYGKTFDCVRHAALMEKMAQWDIYQIIYTTGWSTSSGATPTVFSFTLTLPVCSKLLPALYRAQPSV